MPPKKQKISEDHPTVIKPATQGRTRRSTRNTAHEAPPTQAVIMRRKSLEGGSSKLRKMAEEAGKGRKQMGASVVNNVLALADTLGVKDGKHVDTDRLLFLETVRVMCLVPNVAMVPSKEVYNKILNGIQETKSLEVTVTSFRLLHNLDLRHPQVAVKSVGSDSDKVYEFIDNTKQAWSPFQRAFQSADDAGPSTTGACKVSTDLYLLLESIADDLDGGHTPKGPKRRRATIVATAANNEDPLDRLVRYSMLRWLVSLLDSDFHARQRAFQGEIKKLDLVQGSLIRRLLLGPYYKNINKLLVNMMRIFAAVNKDDDSEDDDSKGEEIKPMSTKKEPASETETGVLERAGTSCSPDYFVSDIDISRLVASLMCMMMELDTFKALSNDRDGLTKNCSTRYDEHQWSALELHQAFLGLNHLYWNSVYFLGHILEGLQQSTLRPLLQALDNPQLKLKLIIHYFVSHTPRRMEEELRSISTVKELLDCVAKAKPNTNVCNKFAPNELQLLLANAFQVFMQIHGTEQSDEDGTLRKEILAGVCQSLRAALTNLQLLMKDTEDLHKTAEYAMFMAEVLCES